MRARWIALPSCGKSANLNAEIRSARYLRYWLTVHVVKTTVEVLDGSTFIA